jgi:hypothetical protein
VDVYPERIDTTSHKVPLHVKRKPQGLDQNRLAPHPHAHAQMKIRGVRSSRTCAKQKIMLQCRLTFPICLHAHMIARRCALVREIARQGMQFRAMPENAHVIVRICAQCRRRLRLIWRISRKLQNIWRGVGRSGRLQKIAEGFQKVPEKLRQPARRAAASCENTMEVRGVWDLLSQGGGCFVISHAVPVISPLITVHCSHECPRGNHCKKLYAEASDRISVISHRGSVISHWCFCL